MPFTDKPLIIGTRGSDLALTQSRMTQAALAGVLPELALEQKIVNTIGDKRPDLKLSEFTQVLDKGIFTKELEIALEAREIDAAVHSLKDVPTELDAQFKIVAVLPRAPIEDVLLFRDHGSLAELPQGAVVATSSVRRKRLLHWMRPDLEIIDIRGNVPTRVRKLIENRDFAATMLARAGLERLGYAFTCEGMEFEGHTVPFELMNPREFLPAAGQGAVAIEIRSDDAATAAIFDKINHVETLARVSLEREFLHLLQAGCQTPVGIHTEVIGDEIFAKAIVFTDEPEPKHAEASGKSTEFKTIAAELIAAL